MYALTRLGFALVVLASGTANAQRPAVTPYEKTGIYGLGKTAGWTIAVAE